MSEEDGAARALAIRDHLLPLIRSHSTMQEVSGMAGRPAVCKVGSFTCTLRRVLLQSLALAASCLRDGSGQVTLRGNLEQLGDEGGLALMSRPPMFRTCPFLIIAIASKPASVRRAVQKPPKPSPGRTRRLMRRWSCSTMLFRYLHWRSRERRHSSPSSFISAAAFG